MYLAKNFVSRLVFAQSQESIWSVERKMGERKSSYKIADDSFKFDDILDEELFESFGTSDGKYYGVGCPKSCSTTFLGLNFKAPVEFYCG